MPWFSRCSGEEWEMEVYQPLFPGNASGHKNTSIDFTCVRWCNCNTGSQWKDHRCTMYVKRKSVTPFLSAGHQKGRQNQGGRRQSSSYPISSIILQLWCRCLMLYGLTSGYSAQAKLIYDKMRLSFNATSTFIWEWFICRGIELVSRNSIFVTVSSLDGGRPQTRPQS